MDTKETVLVVDDDREIVGAIALALEKEGYRVLRAYDGMEALDHALDPELRLILMDVMMPRLDGLSAVPVSYTHLDVYKRQQLIRLFLHYNFCTPLFLMDLAVKIRHFR